MAKSKKGQKTTPKKPQKLPKPQKKEWFPVEWQVVVLFLSLGLVLLVLGLVFRNSGPETLSWPMAKGEIVETNVVTAGGEDGNSENYKLVITYNYTVDEVTYISDQYGLTSEITSFAREPLEKKAETLPAGQKISVYYNPDNPETAVLDPGTDSAQWFLMGSAVVGGLGLCALLLLIALKRKQKQEKFKPAYTFKK